MSRAKDAFVALALLALGRRRPQPPAPREERIVPAESPSPRAELVALALLALASLSALAFVAVYALARIHAQTQYLGLTLGLALVFLAAALTVTARHLVVTEELAEDYPEPEHPRDADAVARIVEESGSRLTRRRLFKLGLAGAFGTLGAAFLTPLASLGPVLDTRPLTESPWRRGRRLVDEHGRPLRASDIEQFDLYTAFPEGADKEELAAPVVVVRLAQNEVKLPAHLSGFQAQGIVAYSKICTHAGCAISLYRTQKFAPTQPSPALVCPCHYSSFDPRTGGDVVFGPAGRKLPMLPLVVDADGHLRAGGNFDEPVGPSWWGVRMRKPT